jgi:hypothetical protein
MRSRLLLSLTANLLLVTVPAFAKVRNIPALLGAKLSQLTASTPLPVLLPQTLPFDYGGKLYASVSGGQKRWSVAIAGAPNCGGATACFIGDILATKNGKYANKVKVTLTDGKPGYFRGLSCGGSCSPPSIEFKRGGVLYEIQAKLAVKGKSDRTLLVAAANSAISHGPR